MLVHQMHVCANNSSLFGRVKYAEGWQCTCRVECCIRCLAQGVSATHIIDGRQPHSLLMELLTDTGVGTMITG